MVKLSNSIIASDLLSGDPIDMEMLHNICDMMGTDDFSAEHCQLYLDKPMTVIQDSADTCLPAVSDETLKAIIKEIKTCNSVDLSGIN